MNRKNDNRLICSEDKKSSIRMSIANTAERRKQQVLKVYECKIVKKRLNNKQLNELEMLFLEGKWFYNHVLNIHRNGIELSKINSTTIKDVVHYDKNGKQINSKLE